MKTLFSLLILFTLLMNISSAVANSPCIDSKKILLTPDTEEDVKPLSSLIPEFKDYYEKMMDLRPSVSKYMKKYEAEHGKTPSLGQALDFYFSSKHKLSTFIRSGKNGSKELDHYLEIAARNIESTKSHLRKYEEIQKDRADILNEPIDMQSKSHNKIIQKFGIYNYKGHLGELATLLRLKNVVSQGVFFKVMEDEVHEGTLKLNKILNNALNKKFSQINISNQEELINKYPHIFKSTDRGFPSEEVIERGKNFLLSKELDVIIGKGGKYLAIEVKNYKGGLTSGSLKKHRKGSKSVLDQLNENVEILKFLEIEDKFTIGFMSIQGMTPDAKQLIEELGVVVFNRIERPSN